MIGNYKKISHIIDLSEYTNCIEKLYHTIDTLRHDETFTDSISILNAKFAQTQSKIDALTPFSRHKRGLINGLGSLVKVVTRLLPTTNAETNKKCHYQHTHLGKTSPGYTHNIQ